MRYLGSAFRRLAARVVGHFTVHGQVYRYRFGESMTMAPAGSGKGVGTIIPSIYSQSEWENVWFGHPVVGLYFGTCGSLAEELGWSAHEQRTLAVVQAIEQWHLLPGEHNGEPAEARMAAAVQDLAPDDRVKAEALLFRLLRQHSERMHKLGYAEEHVVGAVRKSVDAPDRKPALRLVPKTDPNCP